MNLGGHGSAATYLGRATDYDLVIDGRRPARWKIIAGVQEYGVACRQLG